MHVQDERAAARREAEPGSCVRVPLLGALLDQSAPPDRRVWLDLGPAQDGLIRRLNHRRARLLVADLPRARAAGRKDWYRPDALLAERYWSEAVDMVLAWDVLNFADPSQLGRLSAQLAAHARPDCRLHALIRYSVPTMPATPCACRLIQGAELELIEPDSKVERAPRYSPRALEKAMPAFRVEQTVLLNNGMQEFLLALR